MDMMQKLALLGESARYDVSCSSSGSTRQRPQGGIGNASLGGICHTWTADGRCVSLLKVLLTNECIYDCRYCAIRHSNDLQRARFRPRELADLTIEFYRRNFIEGLFLSSGVWKNPDETVEQMIETLRLLREEHRFGGYIHAKAIPGASSTLIERLGLLCDRVSVNIEQVSQDSLKALAPQKSFAAIQGPMQYLSHRIQSTRDELVRYRHAPDFAPAGQSTQIIVGASPEKDVQILKTAQKLYREYRLKRVYYSAYIPINQDQTLPAVTSSPPLLREHRLYQADWLLRFYGFGCEELLDVKMPQLRLDLDPKAAWALRHLDRFPVEINRADYDMLLRIPGIGVRSAQKILAARRHQWLTRADLEAMKIPLKRSAWFITCKGRYAAAFIPSISKLESMLIDPAGRRLDRRQIHMEELHGHLV